MRKKMKPGREEETVDMRKKNRNRTEERRKERELRKEKGEGKYHT